ncbi:MAG: alkaline shock response membrane anchor protein AmaP [Frankia sp.]
MKRTDRLNRVLLLLLGLLMLAAGIGGLLAGTGVFGSQLEHRSLYDSEAGRYVGRNGTWLWLAAAALSVLLALLAVGWLRALAASPRTRSMRIPSDLDHGETAVEAAALTSALTKELRSYREVRDARARLLGDERTPRLRLDVTLESRAQLSAVRARVETEALAHLRNAVAPVQLPTSVEFDLTTKVARTQPA